MRDGRGSQSVGGRSLLSLLGWITPRRWSVRGRGGITPRLQALAGCGAAGAGLGPGLTLMIDQGSSTPPPSP